MTPEPKMLDPLPERVTPEYVAECMRGAVITDPRRPEIVLYQRNGQIVGYGPREP